MTEEDARKIMGTDLVVASFVALVKLERVMR